jgi:hypothetical protein
MDHTRFMPSRRWARSLVPLLATLTAFAAVPRLVRVEPAALPGALSSELERVAALPMDAMAAAGAAVTAATNGAGGYLGFDTNVYPGDRALRTWRESGPYAWVGYYLPAPCHKDDSWSGKRETVAELGYGMAVIYVGQQAWGRTTSPSAALTRRAERNGKRCDAALMSAERGREEAEDAIARTAAEGFAPGTIIYLDVERMERVPNAMRDYYRAWVARVLDDGRFRAGVYVHKHNARLVYDDVRAEFADAGVDEEPSFWVASGRGFSHADAEPTDVGHHFTAVWQGLLDVVESHGGVRLPIDVNVAAVPSPSEQYRTVAYAARRAPARVDVGATGSALGE